MSSLIRLARLSDAAELARIYGPIVTQTHISFELQPPTEQEMASRVEELLPRFPWIVAEDEGGLAGYAYATTFRARPAYRFAVETAVYVDSPFQRRGVARQLYASLLQLLGAQGYRRAVAGIALPNEPSTAFHARMGFRPVGVFHAVGFKFGRWIDMSMWERSLGDETAPANDPLRLAEVPDDLLAAALAAEGFLR